MNGPLDDLLLAQALDAALQAERKQPGSAEEVFARAPKAAQTELRRLVRMASALQTAAPSVKPSAAYRAEARARLLRRIGADVEQPSANGTRPHLRTLRTISRAGRRSRWAVRTLGSLLAATVAVGATLTASASALPGEPLYGLKQAQEELSLRLAADDQARVLALLRRADARLDETARLLDQGRTSEAVASAQRYDQVVERATSTFVVSMDTSATAAGSTHLEQLENQLIQQQERLQTLLKSAPEPARPDLRESLAITQRGRELAADPKPVQEALGRSVVRLAPPAPLAAAAEPNQTRVPTATTVRPTPTVVVAREEREDAEDRPVVAENDQRRGEDGSRDAEARSAVSSGSGRGNERQSTPDRGPAPARGDEATARASQDGRAGGGRQDDNPASADRDDQRDEVAVVAPTAAAAQPRAPAPVVGNQPSSGRTGSSEDSDRSGGTAPVVIIGPADGQEGEDGGRNRQPPPAAPPLNTQQPQQTQPSRSSSSGEGDAGRTQTATQAPRQVNTPAPTATPTLRRESDGRSSSGSGSASDSGSGSSGSGSGDQRKRDGGDDH
jgi:hypothetical protein